MNGLLLGFCKRNPLMSPLPLGKVKELGRGDNRGEAEDEGGEHPNASLPTLAPDIQREEDVPSDGARTGPTGGDVHSRHRGVYQMWYELFRPNTTHLAIRWMEHGTPVGCPLDLKSGDGHDKRDG